MKLGDVVFCTIQPPISLIGLIDKIQGGGPNHCGIVSGFWGPIPLITEAFPGVNVWTIPYPVFAARVLGFGITVKSWRQQNFVETILGFIKTQFGLPYNIHFSDNPNATYCSELIAKAYQKAAGNDITSTRYIGDMEREKPWAVTLFYKYLGVYPDVNSKIWLVNDLMNAKELC